MELTYIIIGYNYISKLHLAKNCLHKQINMIEYRLNAKLAYMTFKGGRIMLEKLYDFLWIFSLVALVIYGILVITFAAFKLKKVKNVRVLQNVTLLAMVTTVILFIVNFIFDLMMNKIMMCDIIIFIVSIIGVIVLYFLAKDIYKYI